MDNLFQESYQSLRCCSRCLHLERTAPSHTCAPGNTHIHTHNLNSVRGDSNPLNYTASR